MSQTPDEPGFPGIPGAAPSSSRPANAPAGGTTPPLGANTPHTTTSGDPTTPGSGVPARNGMPPLGPRTIAGLVAALLLLIGSITAWGSVSVEILGISRSESISGMDSDGELTLVAAIVAIVFLVLRRWPGVVLAAALAAVMITIYDTAQILSLGDVGGGIDISLGWGLILALLASLALTVIAVMQIRDGNADHGKIAAMIAGGITLLFVILAIAGVFDEDVNSGPAIPSAPVTEVPN